jgi:hypothetical protein
MIISTDLPNDEERAASLAAVPWRQSILDLAGEIAASFDNNALDLIDASIGPNHCRAALVALLDAVGVLRSATIALANSLLEQRVFSRVHPTDPLNPTEPLDEEGCRNLVLIYTLMGIEWPAVRVASAMDHLANAHIRLAWEANAATLKEVKGCKFDPFETEPKKWISAPHLQAGIRKARSGGLTSVLPGFVPNKAFLAFMDNQAVQRVRTFRDEIVHRERPIYLEVPHYGRTSLWAQQSFSINFPPHDKPHDNAPTLDERRREVGIAIEATMNYAHSLWEHTKLWLPTIEVWIQPTPDGKVKITTRHQFGRQRGPRFPREQRDPGPFLGSW